MPKPWIVFDDEELTSTQKLVYSCLCKYQGGNESCFPSRKTIALNCGISTATVQRAVNVLVKKRLYREDQPPKTGRREDEQ